MRPTLLNLTLNLGQKPQKTLICEKFQAKVPLPNKAQSKRKQVLTKTSFAGKFKGKNLKIYATHFKFTHKEH